MTDNVLSERRRALEEAFFAKHNEALRQRLRATDEAKSRKAVLAAASGIADEKVLEVLGALGLDGETLTAMSLVPLILIAWADGHLDDSERRAVMAAAHDDGIDQQPAALAMLEQWLAHRPSPELRSAWVDYIGAVSRAMPAEEREMLKTQLLARARRVAEAAGGFLVFGSRISSFELNVLSELERAFAA